MRTTFKQFLFEGGAATAQYNVERANKADIETALKIVGQTLDLKDIQDRLLGSTHLTLSGKKQDSGDIDIVIQNDEIDPEEANKKMLELTKNEGELNKGTKIGSYAVDVGGKKVQVDLMFVDSKEWAKFIFYSTHGENSKYPGAVRNFLLMAVTRHTHEAGKDFIVKKGDEVVARASRAIKLDAGLERLFKAAKYNDEKKKFNKTVDKIDPAELADVVFKMSGKKPKFDPTPDIKTNPDEVAAWLFGEGTKAADIMTAEQVIEKIKKRKDADVIIADARKSLKNAKLPVPKEL